MFTATELLVFEIQDGYRLELQMPETIKLFGSTRILIDNQYQQKSELLYSFTPNKYYTYLLNVEPSNLVFLKTYNTEFN